MMLSFVLSLALISCASTSTSSRSYDDVLEEFIPPDSLADVRVRREPETRLQTFSPTQPAFRESSQDRIVSVRDSLVIVVWGYPEFTTRTLVRATGNVVVPLVGELQVLGLSGAQITTLLREKLAQLIQGDIRLTVEIVPAPPTVIVAGSVARPGSYALYIDTPLLDVISLAGGWSVTADLAHIKIIKRDPREAPIIVNLIEKMEKNDIYSIPAVAPYDAVIIPEKEDIILQSAPFFTAVFGILLLLGVVSGFQ